MDPGGWRVLRGYIGPWGLEGIEGYIGPWDGLLGNVCGCMGYLNGGGGWGGGGGVARGQRGCSTGGPHVI